MEISFLIVGILLGAITAFAIFYLNNKLKNVSKEDYQKLLSEYNEAFTELKLFEEKAKTSQLLNDGLAQKVSSKEAEFSQLLTKSSSLDTQLKNKDERIEELSQRLTIESDTNRNLQNEINTLKQKISELTANYGSLSENHKKQIEINETQAEQIKVLSNSLTEHMTQLSRLTANNSALSEKLTTQKTEIEELQKTAHLQFEKIANKLLEEKSAKFSETNKTNIETLINPLKEDINKFREKVEETYDKESKQRFSLEEKVKDLIEQTNKVSAEANNLATALKGKPQKRGNWGELILERILESSGLTKDREYFVQQSIKMDDGVNLRPDVKINLPDERVIIIDSKVSLIAYDKFSAAEDIEEQKRYLADHLKATYEHIDQLSAKNYDNLERSLDFTMMFVPIEPAYLLAIQGDSDLWAYAYSKRILLVSPTNLIACLKLVSDLWKREWQSKNAMEIVKRGELLYDKVVNFTKTFEELGNQINKTQNYYSTAIDQLANGRGNIVNQAIQLKNLGLKSDKKIPEKFLPLSIDDDDQRTSVSEQD